MNDASQILRPDEITAASLEGWHHGDDALQITFATGTFSTGLALVNQIGDAAEAANHHPDLTLTFPTVSVTLTSHDVGGVTSRDVKMARRVSELAATAGVEPASGS